MGIKRNPRAWPCFHHLEEIEPQQDSDGGKPFKYRCMKCGCLLKIATGRVVKKLEWYYIQNKGYVGDCLLWWRIGGRGYTTNVSQAWKVPKEKALRIASTRPNEDFARPESVVMKAATVHVSASSAEPFFNPNCAHQTGRRRK